MNVFSPDYYRCQVYTFCNMNIIMAYWTHFIGMYIYVLSYVRYVLYMSLMSMFCLMWIKYFFLLYLFPFIYSLLLNTITTLLLVIDVFIFENEYLKYALWKILWLWHKSACYSWNELTNLNVCIICVTLVIVKLIISTQWW